MGPFQDQAISGAINLNQEPSLSYGTGGVAPWCFSLLRTSGKRLECSQPNRKSICAGLVPTGMAHQFTAHVEVQAGTVNSFLNSFPDL